MKLKSWFNELSLPLKIAYSWVFIFISLILIWGIIDPAFGIILIFVSIFVISLWALVMILDNIA